MTNDIALLDRLAARDREIIDMRREILDLRRHNQELRDAIDALMRPAQSELPASLGKTYS